MTPLEKANKRLAEVEALVAAEGEPLPPTLDALRERLQFTLKQLQEQKKPSGGGGFMPRDLSEREQKLMAALWKEQANSIYLLRRLELLTDAFNTQSEILRLVESAKPE